MSELIIKILSLRQPWAWAVVEKLKTHETRSWRTIHRGLIAIHAAKRFGEEELEAIRNNYLLNTTLIEYGINRGNIEKKLVFGAVIGFAKIYGVYPTNEALPVDDLDGALGDWSRGRFAWRLYDVVKLERPIPLIGLQRLFNWTVPDAEVDAVKRALESEG